MNTVELAMAKKISASAKADGYKNKSEFGASEFYFYSLETGLLVQEVNDYCQYEDYNFYSVEDAKYDDGRGEYDIHSGYWYNTVAGLVLVQNWFTTEVLVESKVPTKTKNAGKALAFLISKLGKVTVSTESGTIFGNTGDNLLKVEGYRVGGTKASDISRFSREDLINLDKKGVISYTQAADAICESNSVYFQ